MHESDFHTHIVLFQYASVCFRNARMWTLQAWERLLHAECDFYMHECGFHTHDCDFQTQSVVLTQTSVTWACKVLFQHAASEFKTKQLKLTWDYQKSRIGFWLAAMWRLTCTIVIWKHCVLCVEWLFYNIKINLSCIKTIIRMRVKLTRGVVF
jgi:hypothetical protein